jgi:hypothetical protein
MKGITKLCRPPVEMECCGRTLRLEQRRRLKPAHKKYGPVRFCEVYICEVCPRRYARAVLGAPRN